MNRPAPHFKARVKLTFEEPNPDLRKSFSFSADQDRQVSMSMDGVEGMHVVSLWIGGRAAEFRAGEEFAADCRVAWPEGFTKAVMAGVSFKLWDGGFFARGVVTERCEAGWTASSATETSARPSGLNYISGLIVGVLLGAGGTAIATAIAYPHPNENGFSWEPGLIFILPVFSAFISVPAYVVSMWIRPRKSAKPNGRRQPSSGALISAGFTLLVLIAILCLFRHLG